ncbi:hypothetical protein DMA11_17750 [Marinilabiliaceae bacterium JC017]|nr:hypothetical protein DMA11_17750 [Marinilabiliaceae bacterium JC017]
MKYSSHITIFLLVLLLGCKSVGSITEKSEEEIIKPVQLDELQQRKFDYFFYEANREKMKGNYEKAAMYYSECLKINPTSSASMYELANIYLMSNAFAKAQGLLERAVKINPDNVWYKMLLGELYQQNKLGAKAIDVYEDLAAKYPDNEEYLYGLAQLYQRNGYPDKAIHIYDQLEKKIGLNEILILEKQKIYLDAGKEKAALNELMKLIKKYPKEPRYYGFVADYYLYVKDYDEALIYYNKVLEADENYGNAWFSIGNLNLLQGDTTTCIKNYKKALTFGNVPFEVKMQRILPFIMSSDKSDVIKASIPVFFETIIDTHPFESEGYVYYGNYLKSINKKDSAVVQLKKAIDIEPSNELYWQDLLLLQMEKGDVDGLKNDSELAIEKFNQNPLFYLLSASAYMQLSNNEEALKRLLIGVNFAKNNEALKVQYYASLGDVYYALKKKKEAFFSYDEALKIDENNLVVLNNYSYYLSIEKMDLDRAEKMSSKCVELEPGNSTYLDTYAWVLFQRGRYFEAKYIIERAIDNGGNESAVIVEHYGDILFKNNDIDGALIQWKKAEEMGNDSIVLKRKIENKTYLEE